MLKDDLTSVTDARIEARNAVGLKFMRAGHIPVDDLHALTAGHPELHRDDEHFNPDGIALQADQVATEIEKQLPH